MVTIYGRDGLKSRTGDLGPLVLTPHRPSEKRDSPHKRKAPPFGGTFLYSRISPRLAVLTGIGFLPLTARILLLLAGLLAAALLLLTGLLTRVLVLLARVLVLISH